MASDLDSTASPAPFGNSAEVTDSPDQQYTFEGHVDFFGYHEVARGWLFGGWLAHPWPSNNRPVDAIAHFYDATVSGDAVLTFYFRADVELRGIGYVFFLPARSDAGGALLDLELQFTKAVYQMHPTRTAQALSTAQLTEDLRPVLLSGEEGSQRRKLLDLMLNGPQPDGLTGFVDFYGYLTTAGGWLFAGWIAPAWPRGKRPEHVRASFEQAEIAGEVISAGYERHGESEGEGVIFFLPSSSNNPGSFYSLSFEFAGVRAAMYPAEQMQRMREADLFVHSRSLLGYGIADEGMQRIQTLLARRPFTGEDTLPALSEPVQFETDEAILCEPDGLLLMGWLLAKPGTIHRMRVRSGDLAVPFDMHAGIVVNRADVVEAVGAKHGFDDPRCGFIVFLPHAVSPGKRLYIEIETTRGEIGYRAITRPRLQGMTAIKHILERVNARFGAVPHAFGRVVGPAVEMLNRSRLTKRPEVEVVRYGRQPPGQRFSVIVPLYGRVDFIEYQMALFSRQRPNAGTEYVYVLDDPSRQQEVQFLCASVYARFGVPMTLLLLDRNVGFAPACNIGLAHASGSYVAFVNSDVFPGTDDWLELLAETLEANPDIGVVGPLLLYEDGAVQHMGMEFHQLREFGHWYFGQHTGKGRRYPGGDGLRRCISITGACMMLRGDLARRIGGFDETYIIGDFEDSDLCLRLLAQGYASAVDPTVQLYHLERQSQSNAAATWRLNLTIYNAWQHQRRWAAAIAAYAAQPAGALVAEERA